MCIRDRPHINSVRTKIALFRHVVIWINIKSIIRTCLHARLAGDTPLSVEIDNTIIPIIKRCGRTYLYARCFLTMVAAQNGKEALSFWERPLFHILYPGPVHTDGHFMFRFAGYGACVAANTFPIIDEETEVHSSPWGNGVMENWIIGILE